MCPNGTSPCSENTNIENTVCYAEKDHKDNCPINYMEFAKNDTKAFEETTQQSY